MNCFESFINKINMFFIPSIPETSTSLLKDLMKIGDVEEDSKGWKCFKC